MVWDGEWLGWVVAITTRASHTTLNDTEALTPPWVAHQTRTGIVATEKNPEISVH